ncbi:hypothetical protein LX36DRAFT_310202 [Colletotrichum falcatum]|nr:hypothetical protein LX36DRAFT_310202 [Colletotrichum falcatum]
MKMNRVAKPRRKGLDYEICPVHRSGSAPQPATRPPVTLGPFEISTYSPDEMTQAVRERQGTGGYTWRMAVSLAPFAPFPHTAKYNCTTGTYTRHGIRQGLSRTEPSHASRRGNARHRGPCHPRLTVATTADGKVTRQGQKCQALENELGKDNAGMARKSSPGLPVRNTAIADTTAP